MTIWLHTGRKCSKIKSTDKGTRVLRKSLPYSEGICFDSEMISHQRFVDDIVQLTYNLVGTRTMHTELDAVCKEIGLNMNFWKTQFMTNLIPSEKLRAGGNEITLDHKYKYLVHVVLYQTSARAT